MSGQRILNVGMVGLGGHGRYRRRSLREVGGFRIVAGYDISAEAMEEAKAEDGAEPVESFEALLGVADLDVIVISTGASFHAAQVLAAMDRGYHVFVEKPLCATRDEMYTLVEAQKRCGVVVGMGHNDHTQDPASRAIREQIDSGVLGTVASFEATTAHSGGLLIAEGDWRGDASKNPGGMLFQCGVHKLHELMYYFGPIESVQAQMRYDVHTTQTADVACVILRFASGLIGTLSAYHVTPYRHTLNVFGTKASLYCNHRFFDEGTSLLKQVDYLDHQKQPLEPVAIPEVNDAWGGVRSFYDAVVNGGTPYPSLVDGARAVAAVFAAEESAKIGQVIPVEVAE